MKAFDFVLAALKKQSKQIDRVHDKENIGKFVLWANIFYFFN